MERARERRMKVERQRRTGRRSEEQEEEKDNVSTTYAFPLTYFTLDPQVAEFKSSRRHLQTPGLLLMQTFRLTFTSAKTEVMFLPLCVC